MIKKILFVLIFLFAVTINFEISEPIHAQTTDQGSNEVTVYFFWGDGCPVCEIQKPYFQQWQEDFEKVEVKFFETYKNPQNAHLFQQVARFAGAEALAVPATFIGERRWTGFSQDIAIEMEDHISYCLANGCKDPLATIVGSDVDDLPLSEQPNNNEQITIQQTEDENTISLFGIEIDVGNLPLFFSTFIIAFVDGFNPCSLWVLTFLLGFVAMTGSRKKILIIGMTYLAVSSLVYGFFILGMINFFYYITYLFWIRVVVALIASTFAIINIKDFFFYKKGLSLTIPEFYKPKIYKQARDLRKPETSTWSMVVGAAIMALGITLVELPCTAGFPMIWSSIIASHSVDISMFILLFALYILVYFLDEMLVFVTVVLTLKVSRFEEKHGRFLKLLGGIIMLSLAAVLVIDPILLNDIGGTIFVFFVSALLAVIIAKAHTFYIRKKEISQNKSD